MFKCELCKLMLTCLLVSINIGVSFPKPCLFQSYSNDSAVQRLQEYLRIDTSGSQNLELTTKFWSRQAKEAGLDFAVYRPAGLPICVLTWTGSRPELPSIMLNSHADVVPVDEPLWIYPPFGAHIDEEGNIYGRGAQDDKSLSIQYLEAVRKLKKNNVVLKRTLHITIMPDEETGGFKGINKFIETSEFKSLNIGFALDEGLTSTDERLFATYVDKRPWQMKFTIQEEGGHAFELAERTTVKKLYTLLNLTLSYREQQRAIQMSKPPLDFGAYGTLNVNIIQGGMGVNIIPSRMTVVIDMRLSTAASVAETQQMVDSWQKALGNGTTVEYIRRVEHSGTTAVDATNSYWVAMQDTARDLGIPLIPVVCPGASDMIPLRNIGLPAIGFAPKRHMANLPHHNNEYIPMNIFLQGIDIYVSMLKKLGNLE